MSRAFTGIALTPRVLWPTMSSTTEVPTNYWTKQSVIESDSGAEVGVECISKFVSCLLVYLIAVSEDL